MSLKDYRTDKALEKKGIEVDFGNFKVTIARAGGGNKRFAKLLEAKTRPYKRAIQTETMDNDVAQTLLKEVYSEAIVLNWETKVKDEWKAGIEDLNSDEFKLLPFKPENVMTVLNEVPDVFTMLQEEASKSANYRMMVLEDDAKN